MLNPYLEKTLFSVPVQPIMVEVDLARPLNSLVGKLLGMKLKIINSIPTFGFIGLAPVSPEVIKKVNDLPGVRIVHPNMLKTVYQMPLGLVPGTNWLSTSESRKMLEAEEAFKQGHTGERVKIGVTDTGIDALHPQLIGAEWYSTMSWPIREVLDTVGHGSHCASTAVGKIQHTPMGVTVEGVSRSPLVSVMCLGRGIGTGFTSEIIDAIAMAYDKGAQIISMSLGSSECPGGCEICPECRLVKQLTDRGIIFCIAGGNSGPDANTIGCPGCSPSAITVAAVDKDGIIAGFSSRGGRRFPTKPDVAAPGVNIYSGTSRGSSIDLQALDAGVGYASISGTSMATPHVAGFMALLKDKYPGMSAGRFKEVMIAKGYAHNAETGFGIPKWSYF